MEFSRIRFCQEASSKLGLLKARTGLTPNILSRIGFCLSLNDPTIPKHDLYPPDSDREIDRHVLTGKWDDLFIALIKERCAQDKISGDEITNQFKAHMNRGVLLLFKRVKRVSDLKYILPQEYRVEL